MALRLELLETEKGAHLLIAFLGALALCIWGLSLLPHDHQSRILVDANTFYCAGSISNHGGNPYDGESMAFCAGQTGIATAPFLHTPLTLPVFQLWALLPHALAMLLLTLLQLWALTIICSYIWRQAPPLLRLALMPALLSAETTTNNLMLGQVNLILLAAAICALEAASAQRNKSSGICLTLATLLKPYIGLLFLAIPRKSAWLSALLCTATMCLLTMTSLGLRIWSDFLTAPLNAVHLLTGGFADMPWVLNINISIYGTLRRLGIAHETALICWFLSGVLFLLGTMQRIWQSRHQLQDSRTILSLAMLILPLTILLPGMTWTSYLAWAIPSALALDGKRQWLTLPLLLPYSILRGYVGNLILLVPTASLCLIWILLFSGAGRRTAVP